MRKKGFTLVELLAVIAILAILVIIAMPNVLEMFNKAKQDAFETEVKTHVKAVSNQFITTGHLVYSNVVDGAAKLPMDGEELDYYIELDTKGNIKELNVTNGDYKIEATGTSQNPIKVEQIGDTIKSETAESGEEFAMNSSGNITGGGKVEKVTTLAGTTWKFNEKINNCDILGEFQYSIQDGGTRLSGVISDGSVIYNAWGLTCSNFAGTQFFSSIHSINEPNTFAFIPENNLGVKNGWVVANQEVSLGISKGELQDINVINNGIKITTAPIITFDNLNDSVLKEPELIDWMYENATLQ